MADNYLEKRMEDYRAGKLAPKTRVAHTVTPARMPGDFTLSYPELRALIFGGSVGLAGMVVEMFRKVDAKVAFCHADSKKCTPLAQATGSRYYPFDPSDESKTGRVIDDLSGRWGGVDVVIDLRGASADDGEAGEDGDSGSLRRIASLLLLHSHPDFSCVRLTELESL